MAARLVFWHKARIQERYVIELKIFNVGRSAKYSDGIRYGLICCDLKTQRKVLMDNHHPKGHHVHLDELQTSYKYKGTEQLLTDFRDLVSSHLGVIL